MIFGLSRTTGLKSCGVFGIPDNSGLPASQDDLLIFALVVNAFCSFVAPSGGSIFSIVSVPSKKTPRFSFNEWDRGNFSFFPKLELEIPFKVKISVSR